MLRAARTGGPLFRKGVSTLSFSIEALGRLISRQAAGHPDRARALLRTAHILAGVQVKYLLSRNVLPARCAVQEGTARSMTTTLGRPGRAVCVNIFLPCEVLYALNIPSVLPEGLPCYLVPTATERVFVEAVKKRGVPGSYCSYHKILLGLAETSVMTKPRFTLNISPAYGANQLTFRRLAEPWDVPRFTVGTPYASSGENVTQVAEQLRAMTVFVQAHRGRSLEEDTLRATVIRSWVTMEGYCRYPALQAEHSLSGGMTSGMLSVFATHPMLGSPEALRYTEQLYAQVAALSEERRGKRILQLHTLPHWQDSLRVLLNSRLDMKIAGCDMALDADVLPESEHPYESMAWRLVCSSFSGGVGHRTEWAAELARLLRTDGAVYFCHWGYKQTSGATQLVKHRPEAAGFPTLMLDGDSYNSGNMNDGQMATWLQAFLELLEKCK